tara:strand:- start:644 stop:964 length:321 start_codon:yes stop_codon:yes gene_type:complete
MFKLNQDANVTGTHRQSEIRVAPARLIEKFGTPIESDGYKVSGEYVFEDDEGYVFTVYDWKATTLYSPDYGMTPEYFWSQTTPTDFNIGGHKYAGEFVEWLKKEVG